jgi:hypothetical protein
MTFAKTTQLFDAATAVSASATVTPSRRQDSVGTFSFEIFDGPVTIVLEGRATEAGVWIALVTLTEVDVDANGAGYGDVDLFPFMRASIVSIDGAEVNLWLTE